MTRQVKSFDSERRKLESRIEKLTKQIAVLEKAVEDNRSVKDDDNDVDDNGDDDDGDDSSDTNEQ